MAGIQPIKHNDDCCGIAHWHCRGNTLVCTLIELVWGEQIFWPDLVSWKWRAWLDRLLLHLVMLLLLQWE